MSIFRVLFFQLVNKRKSRKIRHNLLRFATKGVVSTRTNKNNPAEFCPALPSQGGIPAGGDFPDRENTTRTP